MFLRQSTAQTVRIGPFIDDTDFVSEEVALTISAADIRLSKDGGNMVSCSVGATHDEVGYYSVALGTGDTNTVGMLDVMVSETGTLWVKDRFYVLEEAVYDAMFGASAAVNRSDYVDGRQGFEPLQRGVSYRCAHDLRRPVHDGTNF